MVHTKQNGRQGDLEGTLPTATNVVDEVIALIHSKETYQEKLDAALTELPKIIPILADPALEKQKLKNTLKDLFRDMHSVNKQEKLTEVFKSLYKTFSEGAGADRTFDKLSGFNLNPYETTLIKALLAVRIANSAYPYVRENILIIANYLPTAHSSSAEIKDELRKLLKLIK
jgi:hypothetical protein